jgi:molecular chaperone HtpG
MSTVTKNKYEFKAEIKQLLDILIHSLYTHKEIFLRELISNAADALEKVRFQITSGAEVKDKDLPLEINIKTDEKKKILTISDTGIGMTQDELIENIGTIAKSGTGDFLKKLSENKEKASELIGKFGVGFYSVFMVAEKVIIKTRSYKPDAVAVAWESDGSGSFEIYELENDLKRGTTIEVRLKEDEKEFAEEWRIESVIKKHSNFVAFPIKLNGKQINTVSAIWREPKSAIKPEQYNEFYKFLTYDTEDPMEIIHTSVDAPIQFTALLFIPKKQFDFFGLQREDYGLDLYVRRVLIQHKSKDLLPEYLSFVRGVVESEDLPLNVSRETLQENIIFTKIANSVTSSVLNHLTKMAKERPEDYEKFWHEHGRIFTLGYSDFANQEKWLELYRFNSSFHDDEKGLSSFERYVSRMRENQKEIYYLFGPTRAAVENDPHTEIFKKKGIEIIYVYDPLDDFALGSIRKYKDYEIKPVDQADLSEIEKLDDIEPGENEEELSKEEKLHFSSLLAKMKEILGDAVTEVRESKRLSDSPSVLVNPDDALTSTMQKILQIQQNDTSIPKRIMEVNPKHKLIKNLIKVFAANPNDEYIEQVTRQLYESALLLEGYLKDPHALVKNINKMLEQSSDWYVKINDL